MGTANEAFIWELGNDPGVGIRQNYPANERDRNKEAMHTFIVVIYLWGITD